MQAVVLASSHYLEPVHGEPLPALGAALAATCRLTLRRVDRFVQLALLGSARCAQGRALEPDCGVYFASALGPVASNIRVQEQMLREREWPKPFDFIHTLGGSAGYYMASNLGLTGPNWFMGDRHALLAAMDVALTDLAAGAVPQALVGIVEEVPLPLAAQRRRLGVAADTVLGEGSHWWLLGHAGHAGEAGRTLTLQSRVDATQLGAWLGAHRASIACVGLGRDLDPASAQAARQSGVPVQELGASELPFHASVEAAWFGARGGHAASGASVLVANGQLLHLGA